MVPKHTITSRNEGRIYALLRFSNSKEKIEMLLFTILKLLVGMVLLLALPQFLGELTMASN